MTIARDSRKMRSELLRRSQVTENSTYSYILTLAVAVVGNRELVAALLASSLFESAQALVTLAVRPADRSTASRCLALRTAHAPRPSSTHHALLSFFAPHFRAALCRIEAESRMHSCQYVQDNTSQSFFLH